MWLEMLSKQKGGTIENVAPIKQYPSIKYKVSVTLPYCEEVKGVVIEVSGEDRFQTELLLGGLITKCQVLGGNFDNTKD